MRVGKCQYPACFGIEAANLEYGGRLTVESGAPPSLQKTPCATAPIVGIIRSKIKSKSQNKQPLPRSPRPSLLGARPRSQALGKSLPPHELLVAIAQLDVVPVEPDAVKACVVVGAVVANGSHHKVVRVGAQRHQLAAEPMHVHAAM